MYVCVCQTELLFLLFPLILESLKTSLRMYCTALCLVVMLCAEVATPGGLSQTSYTDVQEFVLNYTDIGT